MLQSCYQQRQRGPIFSSFEEIDLFKAHSILVEPMKPSVNGSAFFQYSDFCLTHTLSPILYNQLQPSLKKAHWLNLILAHLVVLSCSLTNQKPKFRPRASVFKPKLVTALATTEACHENQLWLHCSRLSNENFIR